MRRLSLPDIIVIALAAVLIASTLAPAVARMSRLPADARCQSNMQRWAEAMELYCFDNYGRYPTNRSKSGASLGSVSHYQALSPPGDDPATGRPYQLYYSINWVEALYPYIRDTAEKTSQDWTVFRRCPNASPKTWPVPDSEGYPYPTTSYTFNANLVEWFPQLVHNPGKTMMMREYYCTTIALLRPMVATRGSYTSSPQHPFNNGDQYATAAENADPSVWQPHGGGSYILFADGHVRHFSLDYFPTRTQLTAARCWDYDTQQWWNWAPGSGKPAELVKQIAITP